MEGSNTVQPLIRLAGQAERRWFYGGGVHDWLVTSAETGGTFFLFEDITSAGKLTPLHTHPAEETMYVVEGEVVWHLDGTDHELRSGGVGVAPRGVPHAFKVVSETARLLFLHTPGGCEDFYRAASEPLTDSTEQIVDFARVREAAGTAGGIDLLGPPPWQS